MLLLFVVFCFFSVCCGEDSQVAAVRALIARVVPEHARFFVVSRLSARHDDADGWELETRNETVHVRGTSGVAMARCDKKKKKKRKKKKSDLQKNTKAPSIGI